MKLRTFGAFGGGLLLCLPALLGPGLQAAEKRTVSGRKFGSLGNIHATTARMPFYKERRLEFFVRSDGLNMRGNLVFAERPVIDIVRKGAAVEEVARHSAKMPEIYPLNAPLQKVLDFWKERPYSEGVIFSENAEIDQVNQVATGKEQVFVRSPLLDLNGVGFSADFNTRIVTVNSNVEIILRNEGGQSIGSGLSLLGGVSEKQSDQHSDANNKDGKNIGVTRAFCDILTLDLNKKLVILTGNVKVFSPEGKIESEQLELTFDTDDFRRDASAPADPAPPKKESGKPAAESLSGGRLRKARFLGNVSALRNLPPDKPDLAEQSARADSAVYDAENNTLELTGKRPRMARGKDFAEAEKIVILPGDRVVKLFDRCRVEYTRMDGNRPAGGTNVITADYMEWNDLAKKLRFAGSVLLNAPDENLKMTSDTADIFLASVKQTAPSRFFRGNSGLQPEKIIAGGRTTLDRQTGKGEEKAQAGKMTYLAQGDRIVLEDRPVLQKGKDRIEGGRMEYLLQEERLLVSDNSLIHLDSVSMNRAGMLSDSGKKGADDKGTKSAMEIRSRSADLNPGGNKLTFNGAVRAVTEDGMKLQCDHLEITLKDSRGAAAPAASVGAMGRKSPVRAWAAGQVVAEDASSRVESGEMEVLFGEQANPGKAEAEKILARKGVKISNIPDAKNSAGKSSGLLGRRGGTVTTLTAVRGDLDLLRNEADFHEQVKVAEPGLELTCDHLKAIAARTSDNIPELADYRARDEFPTRIAVGQGRELLRIIGSGKVRMKRILPDGGVQRAIGDQAIYEVKKRTVELLAEPPRRPQAYDAASGMVGDKVTIALDTEEINVENGDILAHTFDLDF